MPARTPLHRALCLMAPLTVGCWAPEVAELEPDPPPDLPPAVAPDAHPSPGTAPPRRPATPTPPPLPRVAWEIPATPSSQLPAPPFTAWTTDAPLTLVGPGGTRVASLARYGVRVEVLQVLDSRLRVICSGCVGDQRDAEGWLKPGSLRAERSPGTHADPLSVALMRRASWTGGVELPPGASANAMCLLIDRGFQREGDRAVFSTQAGRAVFSPSDDGWALDSVTPPGPETRWACRTGMAPSGLAPSGLAPSGRTP